MAVFAEVMHSRHVQYRYFGQWLRHQQRDMVHREQLAALEKGVDLPAWPDEATSRFDFGVDSLLLLSGLIWLAIGLGGHNGGGVDGLRLICLDVTAP